MSTIPKTETKAVSVEKPPELDPETELVSVEKPPELDPETKVVSFGKPPELPPEDFDDYFDDRGDQSTGLFDLLTHAPFYCPHTEYGKGNVFTGVCLSKEGSLSVQRGVCIKADPMTPPPEIRSTSGR